MSVQPDSLQETQTTQELDGMPDSVLDFEAFPDESAQWPLALWPLSEKEREWALQRDFITLGGPASDRPPALVEGNELRPERARQARYKRRHVIGRSLRRVCRG
jgi:hypothetical protein